MDLRRLKTFVTIAELGTVSKAAVHLRIGQPALSRQISDLQQELELRLFDRVGRRLVLTAQGEQLLVDCRRVLTDLNSVHERAAALRRGDSGRLKVLAPPHTIESVLSGFLPRYAESFPQVHVELTEALGPEQAALLERGEAHVGIRIDPGDDPRFETRVLQSADVLAVSAASVELGKAGVVTIERLISYPLLLPSGYSVRRLFEAACRLAKVHPKVMLESRASHTLLTLAEAGQGVAIVPSLQRTDRYKVRVARITHGGKPIRERVAVQWDRRRPLPPYALTFCEHLARYIHTVFPVTKPTKTNRSVGLRAR
ncbi:LysR family nitrogen assimilation transcriptional regulator [Bradyrhizobium sp. AZCC 1588]|uniref:LysR family transcriptional regulator n=1 Tax=unclassified Bradyrhizobium TaxID=2631580 RepID=UPI002FF1C004